MYGVLLYKIYSMKCMIQNEVRTQNLKSYFSYSMRETAFATPGSVSPGARVCHIHTTLSSDASVHTPTCTHPPTHCATLYP